MFWGTLRGESKVALVLQGHGNFGVPSESRTCIPIYRRVYYRKSLKTLVIMVHTWNYTSSVQYSAELKSTWWTGGCTALRLTLASIPARSARTVRSVFGIPEVCLHRSFPFSHYSGKFDTHYLMRITHVIGGFRPLWAPFKDAIEYLYLAASIGEG